MVEHGNRIKTAGIIVAIILVIGLAVSLVYAWGPSWLNRQQPGEPVGEGQAELLVQRDGEVVAEPIADLEEFLETANKPVFIDFWAAWCGPCVQAAPFVESLAGEYDGQAYIVKVDVDKQVGIANRYRIQSIPTFMVIERGEIQSTKMGYADQMQPELRSMIDQQLQ